MKERSFHDRIHTIGRLTVILIFVVGRSFFSSNQSYIMVGVIVLSALYSYSLFKKKIIG